MATIDDPIFGTIDPADSEFWEGDVTVDDRNVELDLNIDDPDIDLDLVGRVLKVLRDVPKLAKAGRESLGPLSRSQGADDPLKMYFQHHRDELPPGHFARALGLAEGAAVTEEALLKAFELQRIGVYPGADEETFVMDFGLPGEVTNYLLSVKCDEAGKPATVDFES